MHNTPPASMPHTASTRITLNRCRALHLAALAGVGGGLLLGGVGCKSRPEARTTGFLSEEVELAEVNDHEFTFVAPSQELAMYRGFMIDPVEFRLTPENASELTDEDREELAAHFVQAFEETLGDDFEVVDEPGPGIARVRVAITYVQKSEPILNLHPGTRLLGAGGGAAAMEGEVVDSLTGQVVWATIRSNFGPRVGFDGLSELGDAQAVMQQWARDLDRELAQARSHMDGYRSGPQQHAGAADDPHMTDW